MIQIQWHVFAWIALVAWLIYMVVCGVIKLYSLIYQLAYQHGKTVMEAEDTRTLLQGISEVKADYPGCEEALVALYAKLTKQEVPKSKEEAQKGPIGFSPSKS